MAEGKSIAILSQQGEKISDEEILQLRGLKTLAKLEIEEGDLSPQVLSILQELPNLQSLKLKAAIDDNGLQEIARCRELRNLNLPAADVTDQGLQSLSDLKNLELLRFSSPRVTAAGLEHLAALPRLRFLHTINIPLGDDAVDTIAPLPKLESFYADGSRISDSGWKKLIEARPNLHIHIDQQHPDLGLGP